MHVDGFMPENLKFPVFSPFLANHLEVRFLLASVTLESTEGVAVMKLPGKKHKTVSDVASKETKQLKMETGTVTRLGTCLFSQASLEWELHCTQLPQLQRRLELVRNTLLTSKAFHLLLSWLQDSF